MKKITYTKKDIVDKIKLNCNMSTEESKVMLNVVLDTMKDFLSRPEKNYRIEIRGFGVFEVKETKERKNARNPKTLETFTVPARRKLSFKAGKSIKSKLKKKIQ
tara:strand:- start:138 stop:449 length:312 start_codon:yes stop_codon:yes gene_type:complete